MSYTSNASGTGSVQYAEPPPATPFIGVTFSSSTQLPTDEQLRYCQDLGVDAVHVSVPYSWLRLDTAPALLAAFYASCAENGLRVVLALDLVDGPDGLRWDASASNAVVLLARCWEPVLRALRDSPACAGFELVRGPNPYTLVWASTLSALVARLRQLDATSFFYVNGAGAAENLRTAFHVVDPANRIIYNATLVDGLTEFQRWLSAYQKKGSISRFSPVSSTSSALESAYTLLRDALTTCSVFLPFALVQREWVRTAGQYVEPAYAALLRRLTGRIASPLFHLQPDAYPCIATPGTPFRLVLRCCGYLPHALSVSFFSTGNGTFSATPMLLTSGFNPVVEVTYSCASDETSTLHAQLSGLHVSNSVHLTSAPNVLDYSSAQHVYGVARLMNSYNGPALRVARARDGAQLDVGFNSDGQLSTAALSEFAEGLPLRVTRVYDQSPQRNDLALLVGDSLEHAPELVLGSDVALRFYGRQRLAAASALRSRSQLSLYANARTTSSRGGAAVCVDNGHKVSLLDQGCAVTTGSATQVYAVGKEDGAYHTYTATMRAQNSSGRIVYVDSAVRSRSATSFSTLGEGGNVTNDRVCVGWFPGWERPYWEGTLRSVVIKTEADTPEQVAGLHALLQQAVTASTYTPAYLPDSFEHDAPVAAVNVAASWNGAHSYSGTVRALRTDAYLNATYHYPDPDDVVLLLQQRPEVKTLFLGLLPERVHSVRGGPLIPAVVRVMHDLITACHARGVRVVLHPVTDGLYFGTPADVGVQPGQFAEFVARLARAWRHWPNVAVSLGNTPAYHTREEWAEVAQAAVRAVHAVNVQCEVVVPLHAQEDTPLDSWQALRGSRVLFSTLHYLDARGAGNTASCVPFSRARLDVLARWCVDTGFRCVVHSGWVSSSECLVPSQQLTQYAVDHSHVVAGVQRGHRLNPALQLSPIL